jgi:hypothetical protein
MRIVQIPLLVAVVVDKQQPEEAICLWKESTTGLWDYYTMTGG